MARPPGLSKSRILSWKQCAKRLWLEVYRPELFQADPAAQRRIAIGHQVGRLARDLVPGGGLLIGHEDDLCTALEATREALDKLPDMPLFEPAF